MNNSNLEWLDQVLANTDVRERIEQMVTANATMTNSIVKQLTALRSQLREAAYSKIYEARAAVGDDLLKLTQSLTTLIHYSSVAGEDTSSYVALLKSVSNVTQKLSFFGEDDADGDGVRDDAEGENGNGADLDLEIDDANPPPAEDQVVAPEDEVQDDAETESPDADPEAVSPEDAPADEGSAEPEDGQDAEMDEDGEITTPDGGEGENGGMADDFSNVVKNLKRGKPENAPKEEAEPAAEEGGDEGGDESAEAPTEEGGESDEAPAEDAESDEDENADGKKKKKGGFLDSLEEDAEAGVTAAVADVRFAYLGLNEDRLTISAIAGVKRYTYKPTVSMFNGDAEKLDRAMRKFMSDKPGYEAALDKLHSLVSSGKLKVVKIDPLTGQGLRDEVSTEVDRAQLGAGDIPPGTPWKYRGVGLQHVSNQEACIWFEVGRKEYAALPNAKALKDGEDIDAFSDRVAARLEKLAYDDGLTFLVGLVKKKVIKPIFAGPIS